MDATRGEDKTEELKKMMEDEAKHSPVERVVTNPCPFCGSNNVVMWDNHIELSARNHVCCKDCFCDGPREESTDEAIEAWNKRAL